MLQVRNKLNLVRPSAGAISPGKKYLSILQGQELTGSLFISSGIGATPVLYRHA
jgi:hypothetical protein